MDDVSNKISKIGEQAYKTQETGASGGEGYSKTEGQQEESSTGSEEGPTMEGKATPEQ